MGLNRKCHFHKPHLIFFELWHKAADQGHDVAQCSLGSLIAHDYPVTKCQLAHAYQLGGNGVEQSETAAFEVHGMVISEHAEGGYHAGYFCDRCKGQSSKGHLKGSMRRWFCMHCNQDLCFACFSEGQGEEEEDGEDDEEEGDGECDVHGEETVFQEGDEQEEEEPIAEAKVYNSYYTDY